MYVVIGMVSKKVAGPAVALSFCVAAVSALLSGLFCCFIFLIPPLFSFWDILVNDEHVALHENCV